MRKATVLDLKKLHFWRWNTFFVMLFGYVGYYLGRKNLSAAVPLLSNEFGYSNSDLGLIALYSEVAYAIGKFINGPLGDKIGGRKIFLIGMAGTIACNLIFTQMSHLIGFIIVWCVCRYFLSMGWGGLAKTIGAWYEPEKNGTVMGFISLNFQFGGVLATLLAGWVIASGGDWQDVFFVPAGILVVVLCWSYFMSKDSPQVVAPGVEFPIANRKPVLSISNNENTDAEEEKGIIKSLLSLKIFRILLVYSFLTTFLRSVFFFWTPKFLVDIGMGTSNAILKSAVFPALGCLGTVLLGWYTDRYAKDGNRARAMWIMLVGLTISLITLSILATGSGEASTIVAKSQHMGIVITLGFCGFFLLGPYSMSSGCLTLDIAGSKAAGSCTGMIDGLGYLGGALAVWLAGTLSDDLGWSEVFLLLSVFSLFSVFAAMLMSRHYNMKGKS